MGYQETVIKFKDKNSFNDSILYLNKYAKELDIFVNPCSIITFKERIVVKTNKGLFNKIAFNPGENSICMQGEREFNSEGFVFQYEPKLMFKTEFIPIEAFHNSICEKMFVTHEYASEKTFNKYVSELNKTKTKENIKQCVRSR